MKIGIILGSTRQGRTGEPIAGWVAETMKTIAQQHEVQLIDLADYAMPFVDSQTLPAALEGHYPHEAVQRWSEQISACNALIFVTPEYNHGYPAVLKNAIDWLWAEWKGKPAGIVSYSSGPIGGARCTEQLKLVLSYVGLRVTQNHIHIGSAKGEMPDATKEYSTKSLQTMAAEMEALLPTGPQAG